MITLDKRLILGMTCAVIARTITQRSIIHTQRDRAESGYSISVRRALGSHQARLRTLIHSPRFRWADP